MKKNLTTVVIIIIILVFAGYIVIDVTLDKKTENPVTSENATTINEDKWVVSQVFDPQKGKLQSVTVTKNGIVVIGGENFIAAYDTDLNLLWEQGTDATVTAITSSADLIYAAVGEKIAVFSGAGKVQEEWGPFESNSLITSLSANESYVAFANATNKSVFILDKSGVMKYLIGKSDDPFVVPSAYFDVVLSEKNTIYTANPGNKKIETRTFDGKIISSFGASGTDPGSFGGCCNPAHFAVIDEGFITAEKGINRIKVLDWNGNFTEFVSSVNKFVASVPLDIFSPDGKIIYGANPADSKLYIFTRK